MNVFPPSTRGIPASRRAGLAVRASGVLGAIAAVAVILGATSCANSSAPDRVPLLTKTPPPLPAQEPQVLEQGWSSKDREVYYHTAQGARILRYEWVKALHQWNNSKPFLAPEHVSRYRLLPDPQDKQGLPIGVTVDVDQGKKYFGLTCSACHTGQLSYKGKSVRIDGGASQHDLVAFVQDMVATFKAMLKFEPIRFAEFKKRVAALGYPEADLNTLREDLTAKIDEMIEQAKIDDKAGRYPVRDGFGRQDALGRGGNNGFLALKDDRNLAVADAPVSYPAVWEAVNWDWIQYNGSIQQPLSRNIGEVLGVGGRVVLTIERGDKSALFDSSVNLDGLQLIEETVRKLKPPPWPADVLGAIDPTKAARGKELFGKRCAGCHDNHKRDPKNPNDWQTRMIPLLEIGTDPKQATNLRNHVIYPGAIRDPQQDKFETISAGVALKRVTDGVMARLFKERGLTTPEQQAKYFFGWPENNWRDHYEAVQAEGAKIPVLGYRAHSLYSIWASPPFLHNGSVPSIYHLLSPLEERPAKFFTGNLEYDPAHLGYVWDQRVDGYFEFDVSLPGNSNAGHEFSNIQKGSGWLGPTIAPADRLAIIEYLKTRTVPQDYKK